MPFDAAQLFSFLTETEKFSLNIATQQLNHLAIMRFPQFEEVFYLSVRGEDRQIAMMPTIALNLYNAPCLYLTYSDYAVRPENENPIDSKILGISIPVTIDNPDFAMEDIFEHPYGTFLPDEDKEKNQKSIDSIKDYIQNMIELLVNPLTNESERIEKLNRMAADYVPFVRLISNTANCKLEGHEESNVNINLTWNGLEWSAQLQNTYHPLWNLMLCRADFGVYTSVSLIKYNYSVPLEKAIDEDFWINTLHLSLNQCCSRYIHLLSMFTPKDNVAAVA